MKIFPSLRKHIDTPAFLGFICSAAIHLGVIGYALGVFSRQDNIQEVGFARVSMSLASINTNANQKAYSKPTKPKHKRHHKRRHKHKHPIPTNEILPEEIEEKVEQYEPTPDAVANQAEPSEEVSDAQSNQDSQGATEEAMAFNEGISDEFYRKIQEAIRKKHHYPRLAQIRQLQGLVMVEFVLNTDGSIENVKINQSNAGDILNQQALKTIRDAHKFFPAPTKRVRMRIPIEYGLKS